MKTDSNQYTAWPLTPGAAATLDGTTTTTGGIVIPLLGYRSLGIAETWDGTLTATLTLEVSLNYDRRNPSAARWITITDPSITAFLTSDPTASPPGGKPAGAPGSAYLAIGNHQLPCAAVRWTAARTAGSGNYYLDIVVVTQ